MNFGAGTFREGIKRVVNGHGPPSTPPAALLRTGFASLREIIRAYERAKK